LRAQKCCKLYPIDERT